MGLHTRARPEHRNPGRQCGCRDLQRWDLVAGRTALIVTHRFTTAMRADVIHVMDKGRIIESGSHSELVEKKGLYAASWMTQIQTES